MARIITLSREEKNYCPDVGDIRPIGILPKTCEVLELIIAKKV
jgi:hypothetical protein